MSFEQYKLFPVIVTRHNIAKEETFQDLVSSLRKGVDSFPNIGNTTSKEYYILDTPENVKLKKVLEGLLNESYREVYGATDTSEIYITQSWLNFTKGGEQHHRHIHPNSVLSGVLYLNVYEGDSITFIKSYSPLILQVGNGSNKGPEAEGRFANISDISAGSLLVFPSSLEHEVPPRREEVSVLRVSMAFNTFIRGSIGNARELTELTL